MVFGSSSFVGNPAYTSLNYSSDSVNVQYDFTVPAGQTRYIIIFGQLSGNVSDSTTAVEIFSNIDKLFLAGMAFNDLNQQQLGQIVNWPALGALPRKAIGDFIWFDTNGNGVQDVGEPGLNGIKVDLYSNAGLLLATRTTNSSGNYQFSYLGTGSYYLQLSSTSGVPFVVSPKGQGGDGTKDSDINSDFKTDVFAFDGLSDNLAIDGGLTTVSPTPTPSIDYNGELRRLISNNHYRVLALLRYSSSKQRIGLRNASNNMLQYIRNNAGNFNLIQGANILKLGQSARIAIRTLLAQYSDEEKARAIKALRKLRRSLN